MYHEDRQKMKGLVERVRALAVNTDHPCGRADRPLETCHSVESCDGRSGVPLTDTLTSQSSLPYPLLQLSFRDDPQNIQLQIQLLSSPISLPPILRAPPSVPFTFLIPLLNTQVIRGNSVSSLELVDTAKVWQDRTAPGGLAVGGVQRMET